MQVCLLALPFCVSDIDVSSIVETVCVKVISVEDVGAEVVGVDTDGTGFDYGPSFFCLISGCGVGLGEC